MATGLARIVIDDEFRDLIPPLEPEEREQLLANVLRDGVRDSFVVWKETSILLDGHNRHEICWDNALEFPSPRELSFASRADAKIWVIKNQLGRRNLPTFQRAELALAMEDAIRERAKENKVAAGKNHGRGKVSQNSVEPIHPIDTQKELARIAGVSHDTIAKVKKIVEHAPADVTRRLRSGETTIHAEYKKLGSDSRQASPARMTSGKAPALNWSQAMAKILPIVQPFRSADVGVRKVVAGELRYLAGQIEEPRIGECA